MDQALIIRGRYAGRTFIPDGPLPDAEGPAELIITASPESRTVTVRPGLQFIRHSLVLIAGLIIFFALGRGLWSFFDDAIPTEEGTTGNTIKLWAIIFPIIQISGFVTYCFWLTLGFCGTHDDQKKRTLNSPPG